MTTPKERPILFSGPMVRAILDGRKTQTRRIVKLPDDAYTEVVRDIDPDAGPYWRFSFSMDGACGSHALESPYGRPGDRLWVRETFAADVPGCEFQGGYSYRADHIDPKGDGPANPIRWTPAIHMSRRASRITLEITGVRVERLQAINGHDAIEEGVRWAIKQTDDGPLNPREAFKILWDEINGKRPGCSWAADPWAWVVSFRRLKQEGR